VPCPADDEFIRLYNHGGDTAVQTVPWCGTSSAVRAFAWIDFK
jgi:hypothetical protein